MPLYDLRCNGCSHEFETLARNSALEGVKCPSCGTEKLSRMISRFAVSHDVSRCGTARSDRGPSCGFNSHTGLCGSCGD